jgi:hypothetical protein
MGAYQAHLSFQIFDYGNTAIEKRAIFQTYPAGFGREGRS